MSSITWTVDPNQIDQYFLDLTDIHNQILDNEKESQTAKIAIIALAILSGVLAVSGLLLLSMGSLPSVIATGLGVLVVLLGSGNLYISICFVVVITILGLVNTYRSKKLEPLQEGRLILNSKIYVVAQFGTKINQLSLNAIQQFNKNFLLQESIISYFDPQFLGTWSNNFPALKQHNLLNTNIFPCQLLDVVEPEVL